MLELITIISYYGDWGLGIGDWAQSPIPNPQSPIPYISNSKLTHQITYK